MDKEEYIQQKKDEKDKVYKAIDKGVEMIFENQEYFDYYLMVSSQFPKFNANNVILTVLQNKDATNLKPINEWNELGGRVKKGEKGISLIISDGEYTKPDGSKGIKYKIEKGFDVSQVELSKPLEKEAAPPLADMIKDNIINLMKNTKIKVERADEKSKVLTVSYDKQNNRIIYSPGIKIMHLYRDYLIAASHAQIAYRLVKNKEIKSTAAYDMTLYSAQAKATAFICAGRHGVYYNDLKPEAYQITNMHKNAADFKGRLYNITQDAGFICSRMVEKEAAVNKTEPSKPQEKTSEVSEKADESPEYESLGR